MSKFLKSFRRNSLGYRLLLPATAIICLVSIYPLLRGIYLGFTSHSLRRPHDVNFIGFRNFIDILSGGEQFYGALSFSFMYAFFVVAIAYVVGMSLALLLNKDIKFRSLFRAMILVPWVIPPAVAAINWTWILSDQLGMINITLQRLGIISSPILFLADQQMARATVIITGAWRAFPFIMIVLLAGMQGIPDELYEAAEIDGASRFRSFTNITIPMLKPVSLISTTLMFIWMFNNFENIFLLTRGGPLRSTFVLPILSYHTAFYRLQLGYASAISVIMLVVLLFLALVYMRLLRTQQE